MPLRPKQLPPYYTPGTIPQGTKVHTQTQPISTTTTAAVPAGIYIMPANTLSNDGDTLILNYWGNSYNSATNAIIDLDAFGLPQGIGAFLGDKYWQLHVTIMRVNDTDVYTEIILYAGTTIHYLINGSLGSLDFTIENTIQITIQAPTDGNVRCNAGYTLLIT